jgi:hypothetical protein
VTPRGDGGSSSSWGSMVQQGIETCRPQRLGCLRDTHRSGRTDSRRPGPRAAPGGHRLRRPGLRGGRRRHREDPRHHAPDRLRRGHRAGRPPPDPGGHLHHQGGRHHAGPAGQSRSVGGPGSHHPLRGPAAGALLLAESLRLRAAAGLRCPVPDAGRRRPPGRAECGDRPAARPVLRGVLGEGEQYRRRPVPVVGPGLREGGRRSVGGHRRQGAGALRVGEEGGRGHRSG